MKHSTSLVVTRNGARIKIEPNLIIRGSVFPVFDLRLVPKAEEFFNKSVKIQLLATADLYGGKLCAALDRQHPRDLFDVMLLFNNEGITNEIRQAFIIYLISHNRPMIELLKPNVIDIDSIFKREFKDMTFVKVSLTELKETRKMLFNTVKTILTADERKFILSVKSGNPDWQLFPLNHVKDLPAVQWKLHNISRMEPRKHLEALRKLKDFLNA